jgi:hypothetical protein
LRRWEGTVGRFLLDNILLGDIVFVSMIGGFAGNRSFGDALLAERRKELKH